MFNKDLPIDIESTQSKFNLDSDSNEWDIAAGMLLIREAGGVLLDKSGKPIRSEKDLVIMSNIGLSSSAPKLLQI